MGRARKKIPVDETVEQRRARWAAEQRERRAEQKAAKMGVFETWRHHLNEALVADEHKIKELLSTDEDIEAFVNEARRVREGQKSEYGYTPSEVWRMFKEAVKVYGTIEAYPLESEIQGWRDDEKSQEKYKAFIKEFPDKAFVEYGLKTKIETKLITQLRDKLLKIAAADNQAVEPDCLAEIVVSFLEGFAGLCHHNFETFWLMLSSAPIGRMCLRHVGVDPYVRGESIVVEPRAGLYKIKDEPLEDRRWEENGPYNYSAGKQRLSSDAEKAHFNTLLVRAKQQWDTQK